MHGIARVRTTEEEQLRRKKIRAAEVVFYKSQMEKIFQKRSQKELDDESLKLCTELLLREPDVSTVWNFRREVILILLKENEDEEYQNKLFDSELLLTKSCLQQNPKSYCTWYQRIWVMETRSNPNWQSELALCNAYLKTDGRNFHCWDYRNLIVSKTGADLKAEFDYCTKKIEENFSNYSAWHYRSKLLPKLHPSDDGVNIIEESKYIDELELVINAAFTDPNDTSAFFYQMWLLVSPQKNIGLAVSRITPTKSYIAFNQNVSLLSSNWRVDIDIDGNVVNGVWKSLYNFKCDAMWILEHAEDVDISGAKNITVILKYLDDTKEKVICDRVEDEYVGYSSVSFGNNYGSSIIEKLKIHQESCEQLLELEPDSKWTYFTQVVILHSINHLENYNNCNNIIRKLMELDPKRINYFRDLLSRWHIEYLLEKDLNAVKNGKFISDGDNIDDIKLSSLYNLQYWSACKFVDLKNFILPSNNLTCLKVLQKCLILDLRNNQLESLSGFPDLPELHTLYLDGNNISIDSFKNLIGCKKLKNCKIDLADKFDCITINKSSM